MHPNPAYRSDDRALLNDLIEARGFGMIFMVTPAGPRVSHVPLLLAEDAKLRFHLANSNALTAHLDGATALVVVNGPDGYVSPRHYSDRTQVPTWDYVTWELEGTVSRLGDEELEKLLHQSIAHFELQQGGDPWRAEETPQDNWAKLFKAITGFELEFKTVRPTLKLSQRKSVQERANIAAAHEAGGNAALAHWMRKVRL